MILANPCYEKKSYLSLDARIENIRKDQYFFLDHKNEIRESKRYRRFVSKILDDITCLFHACYKGFSSVDPIQTVNDIVVASYEKPTGRGISPADMIFQTDYMIAWNEEDIQKQNSAIYAIVNDRDTFENIAVTTLSELCLHWIYEKITECPEKVSESNYTTAAYPDIQEVPGLASRYINNLLFQIRLVSTVVTDESVDYCHQYGEAKKALEEAKEHTERLQSQLKDNQRKNRQLILECHKLKDQIVKSDVSHISAMQLSYENQIHELQNTIRKQASKLEDITQKYNALKERTDILESEAEYVGEDEGEIFSGYDVNSNLLFVCDRAPNSGVQRTYDRILNAFSNSRILHEVPTTKHRCDAVVMMTRYMFTHAFYWSVRDFCKAQHIPCVHCDKQGIELIIDDVTGKRRYNRSYINDN